MIVARIESFILNKGLADAVKRANAYSKSGADLILIHSKAKTAKEVFSENSSGSSLPSVVISSKDLEKKISIVDLVILSQLESSKSEIRRLIKSSAIKIDNSIINDDKLIIDNKYFNNNYLKLSVGKKRHIKTEIN